MRRWKTLAATLCGWSLAAAAQTSPPPIPFPELSGLEDAVAAQLEALPETVATARTAGDSEALGEAGRLYQAYGFLATALSCYDLALAVAPSDFRWLYYRASSLAATGRPADAAAAYELALGLQPASVAPRVHLGEALLALGRLPEARAAFETALATAPETAAAFAGLGQVALSERRFGDAVAAFEQALELAPQAGALHYPLALSYRGLGDLESAREHLGLKGTVGVKPPDPLLAELESLKTGERVYLALGRRAFSAGDFSAAEQSFRRALAASGGGAAARINLAAALERLGRFGEARSELEQAVERAPDNATARFNLGLLLSRAGEGALAVEQLREATRLLPGDAEAWLALARELRRIGRSAEAATAAREAISLSPEREEARLEAAGALIDGGELAQATTLLRAAQQGFPASGPIALALTRLLVAAPLPELRDGALALDLAGRLFEARASSDHATLVAAALAELGRCEEAATWQQRAIELAGSAPPAALTALLRQFRELRPCRLALAPSAAEP